MNDAWLSLHSKATRELSRLLRKFLKAQNKRILKACRQGVYLPVDERDALIAAIDETMLGIMGAGAALAIPKKSKAFKLGKHLLGKLSAAVIGAIKASWERIKALAYWGEIAGRQDDLAAEVIRAGVEAQQTEAEILATLKSKLAKAATDRAEAIAIAEVTMALNAGGYAELAEQIQNGTVSSLMWNTRGDEKVRPSHVALEGAVVAVGELFDVGGHSASYPGDPELPAAERAGCRCWLTGG